MLNTASSTFSTFTTSDALTAATIGAMAGTIMSFILIAALILYILTIIAYWKIFEKAGEKGWKILIPIYNLYIMYKIVGMKNWFWTLLFISFAAGIIMTIDGTPSIVAMSQAGQLDTFNWAAHPSTIGMLVIESIFTIWAGILFAWRTSKVFGHGIGYTIGLLLVPNIFWLILGFGKDKYDKKRLKK